MDNLDTHVQAIHPPVLADRQTNLCPLCFTINHMLSLVCFNCGWRSAKITKYIAKLIVFGWVVSLAMAAPLHAQTGQTPSASVKPKMDMGGNMSGGGMMNKDSMKQMHKKMQTDIKTMDDELAVLVLKMNHAGGKDKVNAMAAVITKMAMQRRMLDQMMAAMQDAMMHGSMRTIDYGAKTLSPMTMSMGSDKTIPAGR